MNRDDHTVEGVCATITELSFGDVIADRPFLITNTGELKPAKECLIIPERLLDVWSEDQITALLDSSNRPPLSRYVAYSDRQKLMNWGRIEEISKTDFLAILQQKHLPKPESWRQLLKLWAFVAPDVTGYRSRVSGGSLRLIPAQGKEVLYSASEVVRLAEKRLLQSEADWEFLAAHLLVLNQNWPRFLAEHRRLADERMDASSKRRSRCSFRGLDRDRPR